MQPLDRSSTGAAADPSIPGPGRTINYRRHLDDGAAARANETRTSATPHVRTGTPAIVRLRYETSSTKTPGARSSLIGYRSLVPCAKRAQERMGERLGSSERGPEIRRPSRIGSLYGVGSG